MDRDHYSEAIPAMEEGYHLLLEKPISPDPGETLTGRICALLNDKLGIPGNAVYVTYHPVSDWGWNGRNF